MVEFIVALGIALGVAFIAGLIVRMRFKNSIFRDIATNVSAASFIMLFSFYLLVFFGLNIWSITIIPLLSLIIIFLVIRNAIAYLLNPKE